MAVDLITITLSSFVSLFKTRSPYQYKSMRNKYLLYLDEIVIIFAMTVVRILDIHLIKRTVIVNVSSSTWAMLLLIADGYLLLQFMFFSFFV